MATVYQLFEVEALVPDNTTGPDWDQIAGSAFPIPVLAFDAATDETAYMKFRAFSYGSGSFTIDIDWYADTASTGDVVFNAQVAAITPNTDTTDIETKGFAATASVTDTHLGTTGQRLHRASFTCTAVDSVAADDDVTVKIVRPGSSDAADTMAGDVFIRRVVISYSDA